MLEQAGRQRFVSVGGGGTGWDKDFLYVAFGGLLFEASTDKRASDSSVDAFFSNLSRRAKITPALSLFKAALNLCNL